MRLHPSVLVLFLAGAAAAQSSLQPGDIAVVTTAGLHLLRPPAAAIQLLPDAAFGGLTFPAVEWRTGTDHLLVASGSKLFDVTVSGAFPPTASVTDITPAGLPGATLLDLDVHPATGELYLLDSAQAQVLRYAPPFAVGMAPDLVITLQQVPRALSVDSAEWPPTVVVGYSDMVRRHELDGTATPHSLDGANGLDRDRQTPPTTLVSVSLDDLVRMVVNPQLVIEINMLASLCAPVALTPLDVEYDTEHSQALVLAGDGLNPVCMPGYFGGNHVLRMPLAQSPGVPPLVLTGPASGIAGQSGDLAWVTPDFAFVSPYGSDLAPAPTLLLSASSDPAPGNPAFMLKLAGGPHGAPAFLLAGVAPLDLPLPAGQAVLVAGAQLLALGPLSTKGKLEVSFALPAGLPVGVELFVQGAAAGPLTLSNGMLLHISTP